MFTFWFREVGGSGSLPPYTDVLYRSSPFVGIIYQPQETITVVKSCKAVKLDMCLRHDRTFVKGYQVVDAAKVAQDITGYTARMQIVDASESVVVDISTNASATGQIAINGPEGTVTVTIDNSAITPSSLPAGTGYRYDITLIDDTGEPDQLIEGRARVETTITPGVIV